MPNVSTEDAVGLADLLSARPSLRRRIRMLEIDDRAWRILRARVDGQKTLQQIGDAEGVSRERVRQIIRRITDQIRARIEYVGPALDALEANHSSLWQPFDPELAAADALEACRSILFEAGWRRPHIRDMKRLVLAIRTVGTRRNLGLEAEWPEISYLFCALAPPVVGHSQVALAMADQKRKTRKMTYGELGRAVLDQAGIPLHWREIASRAERIGNRASFNATSIYNALVAAPETFARVGPGTYGLTAWGLSTVDPYPDIMAAILQDEARALTFGKLYQEVNARRPIKATSLQMYLDIHPRFYRSIENTCGLRRWLPSRERQTLQIEDWLVETRDSYKRVEQAKTRGYNVDKIIEDDSPLYPRTREAPGDH